MRMSELYKNRASLRPRPGLARFFANATHRAVNFCRSEDGTSAVEFALIASFVLVPGLLFTADLGFEAYERVALRHSLRAGAQSAMSDPGKAHVLNVVKSTDKSTDTNPSADPLTAEVEILYACPESVESTSLTPPTCAASAPPYVYYRLTGSRNYDGILSNKVLKSSMQIQIR